MQTSPSVRRLTPAELGERVIDALVPAHPDVPDSVYHRPTWPEVWSDVRTVFGPLRSAFFIVCVVAFFPILLVWRILIVFPVRLVRRMLIAKPVMTALLLTSVLGTGALWFWGWPGLLVVCLFVWLFTLFRQNQKPRKN